MGYTSYIDEALNIEIIALIFRLLQYSYYHYDKNLSDIKGTINRNDKELVKTKMAIPTYRKYHKEGENKYLLSHSTNLNVFTHNDIHVNYNKKYFHLDQIHPINNILIFENRTEDRRKIDDIINGHRSNSNKETKHIVLFKF